GTVFKIISLVIIAILLSLLGAVGIDKWRQEQNSQQAQLTPYVQPSPAIQYVPMTTTATPYLPPSSQQQQQQSKVIEPNATLPADPPPVVNVPEAPSFPEYSQGEQ